MVLDALLLRFVTVLSDQGGSSGNIHLRDILGWKEKTYKNVCDELASRGVIAKGRGRGGSVCLIKPKTLFDSVNAVRCDVNSQKEPSLAMSMLAKMPPSESKHCELEKKQILHTYSSRENIACRRASKMTKPSITRSYRTPLGEMIHGKIEDALISEPVKSLRGKINLIVTSPPFPLVRKKKYGNKNGDDYVEWLRTLSRAMSELLTKDGSIVIEIGNAWEEGSPVMSTLPLEALLAFKQAAGLHLCQHVICHNPARLPSPAAWVNINRIRLKDSYTHVWWMSTTEYPKADNRKVLNPYSADMKRLLKSQKYNAGVRPSGHVISATGFLKDHGGSIGPNVLDLTGEHYPESLLKFTGTKWDANYRHYCKQKCLPAHPARMQSALAAFFIQFLTDENDFVFDPFAGSNTTGAVAEEMGRKWIAVEANQDYITGSRGRFEALCKDGEQSSIDVSS